MDLQNSREGERLIIYGHDIVKINNIFWSKITYQVDKPTTGPVRLFFTSWAPVYHAHAGAHPTFGRFRHQHCPPSEDQTVPPSEDLTNSSKHRE